MVQLIGTQASSKKHWLNLQVHFICKKNIDHEIISFVKSWSTNDEIQKTLKTCMCCQMWRTILKNIKLIVSSGEWQSVCMKSSWKRQKLLSKNLLSLL